MTQGITARQTQILKTLVEEYISTAEPVGSLALEKKHSLGVSPATIRIELGDLTKAGYLKQPHTSAGRIPTPKALKFYISQLMEEKQMSLTEEVKAKEQIWDSRDDLGSLVDEATQALADYTHSLSIGVIDNEEKVYHSGYSNIFTNPEFADTRVCANIFDLLEEVGRMQEIFFRRITGISPVEVLFGEEMEWPELSSISVVATQHKVKGRQVALGVIGPARLSYSRVVPALRYFGNLLEEIAR